MSAVRMMEPALHEVIRVIAVRDGFVTAARTVDVFCVMRAASRLTAIGIGGVHRQRVLVVMTLVRVVQVAVVQVIDVPVVLDRRVAAAGPVLMIVMFVGVVLVRHEVVLLLRVFLAK